MNFSASPIHAPANAAPCLAVITLGSDGPRHSALMGMGVDASATDRVDIGHNIRTVYWRCLVGVANDALVMVPLENPPNPLMDNRPTSAEGKQALPEHDTSSLSGKIAHLLHHDRCHAKEVKAAPVTDFPAVIDGKPLAGISVPIARLDSKHLLVNTKPKETYVQIPVGSDNPLEQATLSFEFDDWLSSKGEAEVLGTELKEAFARAEGNPASASATTAPVAGAGAVPPTNPLSQAATRSGRDTDGSTHPSGDGQYRPGWQDEWRGN